MGGSGATFGADMSVAPEPYRTCGHTGYFQKSLRNHISIHTRSIYIYICYIILSHIVYYSVLYHIVLYYKGESGGASPVPEALQDTNQLQTVGLRILQGTPTYALRARSVEGLRSLAASDSIHVVREVCAAAEVVCAEFQQLQMHLVFWMLNGGVQALEQAQPEQKSSEKERA